MLMQNQEQILTEWKTFYTNSWLQLVFNKTKFIWEQLMEILNNVPKTLKDLSALSKYA